MVVLGAVICLSVDRVLLQIINGWSARELRKRIDAVTRFFMMVALLAINSSYVFSEDLSLQERRLWLKDKTAALKDYSRQYQAITDDISAAQSAIAPRQLDTKPYRPRMAKIQTDMAYFIEKTNFDALHRFRDNPLCSKSIESFQGDLQNLKQHKMDPMSAALAYSLTVMMQCPLSPRVYEATKKLEQIQSENHNKP